MATATRITLEEFLANPDPHFFDFHELHDGEVVIVPPPSLAHQEMQKRLERLLDALLAPTYTAFNEFYYLLPTESRRADIAAIPSSKLQDSDRAKRVYQGSPDLVIEILSPSNEYLDVDHIRSLCLKDGTLEFWVINPDLQTVTVFGPENTVTIYTAEASIPLDRFVPKQTLRVADIFPQTIDR